MIGNGGMKANDTGSYDYVQGLEYSAARQFTIKQEGVFTETSLSFQITFWTRS